MRRIGTIRILHRIPPHVNTYGGCYGVIVGDDGIAYMFNGGNFYRNMSQPYPDARVTFEAVGYGYASNIDVIEKRSPVPPLEEGLTPAAPILKICAMVLGRTNQNLVNADVRGCVADVAQIAMSSDAWVDPQS